MIDLVTLPLSLLRKFFEKINSKPEIKKIGRPFHLFHCLVKKTFFILGYGILSDIDVLVKSFPAEVECRSLLADILDLETLQVVFLFFSLYFVFCSF